MLLLDLITVLLVLITIVVVHHYRGTSGEGLDLEEEDKVSHT